MILNSSGNVGKSTIARELFYPRLSGCLIIEVETVNKSTKDFSGFNVYKFEAGQNFEELYLKLMENENVILDIGASNLGEFWRQMSEFAGVEMLFDYFVIPSIPNDKVMADTYKTISFLRDVGIDDNKIKVIFNQVSKNVDTDFSVLLKTDFDFDKELYIKKSTLFTDLGLLKKSIKDIYNPNLDFYKNKILEAKDSKQKLILVKSDLANRMAHTFISHFDFLFEKITGEAVSLKNELDKNFATKNEIKKEPKRAKKEVKEAVNSEVNENDDDL